MKEIGRHINRAGYTAKMLPYVPVSVLSNDDELARFIIRHAPMRLVSCSDRVKNDARAVTLAVQQKASVLQFAAKNLREDTNFIESLLKKNPLAYAFVLPVHRDSEKIAKYCVERNWQLVQYASTRLRDNKAFMEYAMKENPRALCYASNALKINMKLLVRALQCGGDVFYQIFKSHPLLTNHYSRLTNAQWFIIHEGMVCDPDVVLKGFRTGLDPSYRKFAIYTMHFIRYMLNLARLRLMLANPSY